MRREDRAGKADRPLFFWLAAGFILATAAGTLLHECGHYLMAKILGYEAVIHYQSTSYVLNSDGRSMTAGERILVTAGGPVQTILTGTAGILLLFRNRQPAAGKEKLSAGQWILVFLSLFWLRQVAIFAGWAARLLFTGQWPDRGDEVKISRYYQLPGWVVPVVTGIIGMLLLYRVLVRIIPGPQRKIFIAAGLSGGILGYLAWFEWLGKQWLP